MDIKSLINLPDFIVTDVDHKNNEIIISGHTDYQKSAFCPECKTPSKKIHSRSSRTIQDVPISLKTVWLKIRFRKLFCQNPACKRKFFAEEISFANEGSRRTNRLNSSILRTAAHTSSLTTVKILKRNGIIVQKSSICNLLKKNRSSDRSSS